MCEWEIDNYLCKIPILNWSVIQSFLICLMKHSQRPHCFSNHVRLLWSPWKCWQYLCLRGINSHPVKIFVCFLVLFLLFSANAEGLGNIGSSVAVRREITAVARKTILPAAWHRKVTYPEHASAAGDERPADTRYHHGSTGNGMEDGRPEALGGRLLAWR